MIEILVAILVLLGALATLVAGVGLVRMPDLYTRMQATSKAATLGAILVLLGTALAFGETAITVLALVVVLFLALTVPVASHMLARAGYVAGVRMADPGAPDELEGRYEAGTHRLRAPEPTAESPARDRRGSA
ncbi:MAG TPA: monovalent cation/H(+) antiporter subunit G [Candidatus Krumholzibacteria bacterium]|nr:monovalent cation/H(+) antiporter subunit G [Candidatus Krumholzibacteria bacterium]